MNWGEFKEYVDRKLKEEGYDDTIDIWYIDVSHPTPQDLDIEIPDEERKLTIY